MGNGDVKFIEVICRRCGKHYLHSYDIAAPCNAKESFCPDCSTLNEIKELYDLVPIYNHAQ